jgi:TetR/AcrR family transcriptional regulator
MDDIAAAAEMSRPAVYQYVRNKDDAFRRLATRLFDAALHRASAASTGDGPLAERVHRLLAVKLELTLQLWHDSPHAAELLDTGARLSGALVEQFTAQLRELITTTVSAAAERGEVSLRDTSAAEVADIALALTRGLESGVTDPDQPRRHLHRGIHLLITGLPTP